MGILSQGRVSAKRIPQNAVPKVGEEIVSSRAFLTNQAVYAERTSLDMMLISGVHSSVVLYVRTTSTSLRAVLSRGEFKLSTDAKHPCIFASEVQKPVFDAATSASTDSAAIVIT